jgi:hypothetical protein
VSRLRHKNATATFPGRGFLRILAGSLNNKVYSGAVFRACQILGGPDEVARRTGVSCLLIRAILKESLVPPPSVFLKIVDIVMSAEGTEARRQG